MTTMDGFIIHYGPIYGPLPSGNRWHTLCPCQDQGAVAMSTHMPWIDCEKCLKIIHERPPSQR